MSHSADVSLPPPVWQLWLRPRGVTAVQRIGGGFSGARLYRCSAGDADQAWVLRCWPPEIAIERVVQIHHVLELARRRGCDLLPIQYRCSGEKTVTLVDRRCWELAQWLPGRPYGDASDGDASDSRGSDADLGPEAALSAAAAAVAQFHLAVADAECRSDAAPAVADRLRRIEQLDRWLRQPPSPPRDWPAWLSAATVVAARAWLTALPALRVRLAAAESQRRSLQYVLRDIHRQHVLFDGRRVSGLIDFDALRVDTPATDLARLVASFACDLDLPVPLERLWQAALSGYRQHRALAEEDHLLARLLADVSPLISLANWVVWVGLEQRRFDAGERRVVSRIEHLTRWVRRMDELK